MKARIPEASTVRRACCLGGRVDASTPRCGVVHSVFAGAVNLRFADGWWTLLAAHRPDQPSGLRLAPESPDLPPIRAGSTVQVRAGHVRAGDVVIDCRAATRWMPGAWPHAAPGFEERLRWLEAEAARRAWTGAAPMARALCDALDADDLALAQIARRVVGRGPGLTPSGDDVLVGLLTALGMRRVAMRDRLARVVASALYTTTDLSRHMIHEAALGLPGRALHELGAALLSGAGFAGATRRALDTGATSGADTALGLIAGCRRVFPAAARGRA